MCVSQYLGGNLFQVAIAPDDPKFIAVTADHINQFSASDTDLTTNPGPKMIWVSTDAGQNWDLAYDGAGGGTNTFDLGATETIRNLDISIDYGGKRDIGFRHCQCSWRRSGQPLVRQGFHRLHRLAPAAQC